MIEFDSPSLEDIEYILNLPYHLSEARMSDDLSELLTEFYFLEHKILIANPQLLIEDFDLSLQPHIQISESIKNELRIIQSVIRLASNILIEHRTQLAEQLWGRIQTLNTPAITRLLEEAKQSKSTWLCPVQQSLTSPKGNLQRTLTGHTLYVYTVATIPNSDRVISASADETLKVWNINTGEEYFTLAGHRDAINAVAVTNNGQKLVSASSDKTLKVWNLKNKQEIFTLNGHSESVDAVAITQDGNWAISGSLDRTLKIWDLRIGSEFCIKREQGQPDIKAKKPRGFDQKNYSSEKERKTPKKHVLW